MTNSLLDPAEKNLSQGLSNKKAISVRNWTIWHVGAGVGLLGGLAILFGASFLMIFEYFYAEDLQSMWLFLTVLPLWVFGAHCFDKVEDSEKAERIENYKERNEAEF